MKKIIFHPKLPPAIEPRIEAAAAYLGIGGGFDGFVAYVTDLKASLNVPKTLGDLGFETLTSTASQRWPSRIQAAAAIRLN